MHICLFIPFSGEVQYLHSTVILCRFGIIKITVCYCMGYLGFEHVTSLPTTQTTTPLRLDMLLNLEPFS